MSPIPRILDEIRVGSNTSSASRPSPVPRNLIGIPVTSRMEIAAPPRASPSILVKINPLTGITPTKPLATFSASCPIIESTTSRISFTGTASFSAFSSSISSSSNCERPAVSRITTEKPPFLATSRALFAICTGFAPFTLCTGTSIRSPKVCNCLMAAGR